MDRQTRAMLDAADKWLAAAQAITAADKDEKQGPKRS